MSDGCRVVTESTVSTAVAPDAIEQLRGGRVKRLTSAAAVLLFFMAVPLFASERRLVDDVIRMSKAGVSEDAIIVFVQNTRGSVELSADDIIAMTEAGLHKP